MQIRDVQGDTPRLETAKNYKDRFGRCWAYYMLKMSSELHFCKLFYLYIWSISKRAAMLVRF